MHLVTPLAAGVKGAENGIAEVYKRGTTTSAPVFFSFEGGDTQYGPVSLDSHGGAAIYVRELCTVVVKTAGGAVIREFVDGVKDDAVEVTSDSFTGESYDTAMSGAGQPTTLGDVLDRWQIFNGGTDWMVQMPDGSLGSIKAALAGSFGVLFNVRAYGALGNGATDDTAAINTAIASAAAAGGGIVYFPTGNYRTTGGHILDGRVSLIGTGPGAAILSLDNPSASFIVRPTLAPTADRFHLIANMAFSAPTVALGASVIDLPGNCRTIFSNLFLDGTAIGLPIVNAVPSAAELFFANCVFQLGQTRGFQVATTGGSVARAVFRDCKFITPTSFTGVAVVRSAVLDIRGCVFDNLKSTTGTYSCIESISGTATPVWLISGCNFISGSGAAVTAMNFGTYTSITTVTESQNIFGSTVTAYAYTVTGAARGAQITLGSRELRSTFITDATTTPSLPIDQYGVVFLSSSQTGATVFSAAKQPPEGARGTILVLRTGAAPGTVTAGANFMNPAAIATVQNGTYQWDYRVCIPASTVRMALSVDGRNNGATP